MKKLLFFFLSFINIAAVFSADSSLLQFKFKAGDNYRILSTVSEDVRLNGRMNHHAEIINRVAVNITKVGEDGRGWHEATFMTTENSTESFTRRSLTYGDEYESKFWRNSQGVYDIANQYFMPVVRDVPTLPETPVKIGDTWTASGHEAHDLRKTFVSDRPFIVPFTAQYEYLRDEEGKSSDNKQTKKTFQVLSAKYTLFFESPIPEDLAEVNSDFPVTTMGYSNQTIWWDNEKGQIDHYTEDFRIVLETYLGNQIDFTGTAHAEVTEFDRTGTEKVLKEVREKIDQMALENVSVTKSDKGLTISVENIQFEPDSAELMASEKDKIKKIAEIVQNFPNDLLVTGHTAKVGTEESCQKLSEERADSVANYMMDLNVRDKYHIFTQGFGAKLPIATNSNEKGRSKNRRVEITILDK
ncbi:MAG: OmpA family protein [Treponema sp.]|nr:OmpA family protein [Candidatus Treponema equifaecale]